MVRGATNYGEEEEDLDPYYVRESFLRPLAGTGRVLIGAEDSQCAVMVARDLTWEIGWERNILFYSGQHKTEIGFSLLKSPKQLREFHFQISFEVDLALALSSEEG